MRTREILLFREPSAALSICSIQRLFHNLFRDMDKLCAQFRQVEGFTTQDEGGRTTPPLLQPLRVLRDPPQRAVPARNAHPVISVR